MHKVKRYILITVTAITLTFSSVSCTKTIASHDMTTKEYLMEQVWQGKMTLEQAKAIEASMQELDK